VNLYEGKVIVFAVLYSQGITLLFWHWWPLVCVFWQDNVTQH
jgi:hypothetical protein